MNKKSLSVYLATLLLLVSACSNLSVQPSQKPVTQDKKAQISETQAEMDAFYKELSEVAVSARQQILDAQAEMDSFYKELSEVAVSTRQQQVLDTQAEMDAFYKELSEHSTQSFS